MFDEREVTLVYVAVISSLQLTTVVKGGTCPCRRSVLC